jgi:predicted DNA-binding transcriptional regulator AlpA
MFEEDDDVISMKEVARMTGIRQSAFYNGHLGTNEIPYIKLGGRYFYRRSEIRKWLDANTHYPPVLREVKRRA